MPRSSTDLHRDLLEAVPKALIAIDARDTILYANACAHRLFGYEPETLNGLDLRQLVPEAPLGHWAAAREAGRPLLAQRKGGGTFRAEVRLSPFGSCDRQLTAVAVRDVTDHVRIVTGLTADKEAAEAASASKVHLLAAASHDLRQPLQTLHLLNGTMKRLTDDAEIGEVLDQEERALDRMSDLINALLHVTKLESGALKPCLSVQSLDALFEDLRHQFITPARLKGLDLRIAAPGLTVRTDATLLHELLQNLLANAIRYTDAGRVALHCRSDSAHTWIVVEDSGIGMPG